MAQHLNPGRYKVDLLGFFIADALERRSVLGADFLCLWQIVNDVNPRQIIGDRLASRRLPAMRGDGDLGNFFGGRRYGFSFIEQPALIGRNRCGSLFRGTAKKLLLQPAVLFDQKCLVLFEKADARAQMINRGLRS